MWPCGTVRLRLLRTFSLPYDRHTSRHRIAHSSCPAGREASKSAFMFSSFSWGRGKKRDSVKLCIFIAVSPQISMWVWKPLQYTTAQDALILHYSPHAQLHMCTYIMKVWGKLKLSLLLFLCAAELMLGCLRQIFCKESKIKVDISTTESETIIHNLRLKYVVWLAFWISFNIQTQLQRPNIFTHTRSVAWGNLPSFPVFAAVYKGRAAMHNKAAEECTHPLLNE